MPDRERVDAFRVALVDDPPLDYFDFLLYLLGLAISFLDEFLDLYLLLFQGVRAKQDRTEHRALAAASIANRDDQVSTLGWVEALEGHLQHPVDVLEVALELLDLLFINQVRVCHVRGVHHCVFQVHFYCS